FMLTKPQKKVVEPSLGARLKPTGNSSACRIATGSFQDQATRISPEAIACASSDGSDHQERTFGATSRSHSAAVAICSSVTLSQEVTPVARKASAQTSSELSEIEMRPAYFGFLNTSSDCTSSSGTSLRL